MYPTKSELRLAFCLTDKYITMNKPNIDQALAALGDALKSQQDQNPLSTVMSFVKQMPKRALSGDHINGGKIFNFSSFGITDTATKEQLVVADTGITVKNLSVEQLQQSVKVNGDVTANTVTATKIVADVLEVKEIKAEIKFEKHSSVVFSDEIYGKGMAWTGKDYTKQFIFSANPDSFFSSEHINVARDRHFAVNGLNVLSEKELGPSVTKSHLREVGRLKGLVVDGGININQYLIYNGTTDRLGLGTDAPNAALSVAEMGIEVMVGTTADLHGMVGTHASQDFDIVTDDTARITVRANGNIDLGNPTKNPAQVTVHGKLAVGVKNPDPTVDLHVAGAVRLNNRLQMFASAPPTSGTYNVGDMVWNDRPRVGGTVGWYCLRAGDPGVWNPFGEIKENG
jgi:hypothetical protein